MQGAIVKSYIAANEGVKKENIVMVSVMPCTAKKFEITRDDECGAGVPDVDIVITTNELAKLLKEKEIQLEAMNPKAKFDDPLGQGSGAGVIFGAAGGVIGEAGLYGSPRYERHQGGGRGGGRNRHQGSGGLWPCQRKCLAHQGEGR